MLAARRFEAFSHASPPGSIVRVGDVSTQDVAGLGAQDSES